LRRRHFKDADVERLCDAGVVRWYLTRLNAPQYKLGRLVLIGPCRAGRRSQGRNGIIRRRRTTREIDNVVEHVRRRFRIRLYERKRHSNIRRDNRHALGLRAPGDAMPSLAHWQKRKELRRRVCLAVLHVLRTHLKPHSRRIARYLIVDIDHSIPRIPLFRGNILHNRIGSKCQ